MAIGQNDSPFGIFEVSHFERMFGMWTNGSAYTEERAALKVLETVVASYRAGWNSMFVIGMLILPPCVVRHSF
jgi:hypothetical protein